ncbi:MAG TPA: hypothetical protein VJN02_07965 [Gammaproteobacteria bacterium]|nr:hypothetical protein [Gammaproteobacteria bacterium]
MRALNPIIKEILEGISKRYGVTLSSLEEIYKLEFKFVAETMKRSSFKDPESFKNINLIKFGKFYYNKDKVQKRRVKVIKRVKKHE